MRLVISVIVGVVFWSVGLSQPDLKFKPLSIKDGLTNNSINDILKDSVGFIWVATDDGLNRYDGHEFKAYHHSDSSTNTISSNTVYCLFQTRNGDLLAGTQNGLSRFNPVYESFDHLILSGVRIKQMIQSEKNGTVYLTTDKGLFLLDESLEVLEHYCDTNSVLTTNNLKGLDEGKDGSIWLAAYSNGVYRLMPNGDFMAYSFSSGKLNANYIECVLVRGNDDVLVATHDNGIFQLNKEKDAFEPLKCRNCKNGEVQKVVELYEDEENRLWIGTDGQGLGLYDENLEEVYIYKHHSYIHSSLSDDVVNTIYSDGRGGLWVGTFYRGLNFVNLFSAAFTHVEEIKGASDHNIVCSIAEDGDENLWLATDGGGIVHYSKDFEYIEAYNTDSKPFIASNSTLSMLFDGDDLWVGTYFGGAQRIETKKHEVTIFKHDESDSTSIASDVVWFVYRDSKKRLWFCTLEGLSLYNKETNSFKNYTSENSPLKSSNVRIVYEDVRGDYWFGTEDALYRYDQNGEFHEYTHDIKDPSTICNNWIVTINEDEAGNLWLGSYGGGISMYRPQTDNFVSYDTRHGLCNNFICGILSNSPDDLWISTLRGVSHFNTKTKSFESYYSEDGLQGDKFSINSTWKGRDDMLMFGGINGLTSFTPDLIKSNCYEPPLAFTDFMLLNKSVDVTNPESAINEHISLVDKIVLPYDYSVFTLKYAGLNYIQSSKNQFAYRLKGFDKDWQYVGGKTDVTYTNLAPGKYTFELIGANNNDVWSEKPISFDLVVTPPYYRTWWFRLLATLFVSTLLVIIYRVRVNRIVLQKNLLKRKVDERTQEIHEKTKALQFENERYLESLGYAKLIQQASLPSLDEAKNTLKECGVFYQPSQIVSGDFYWIREIEDKLIIAAVDCTGHGVPGAFMSLIGHVALSNIVNFRKIHSAEQILEQLHLAVIRALRQQKTQNKDGMDMGLVVIDKKAKKMEFAGAMNPIVYIQNNDLKVIKGVRRGIGGTYLFSRNKYEKHVIDISDPTSFYLFTDGFQDQIGGDTKDGKKFMARPFREFLFEIHSLPIEKQIELLKDKHMKWKGYFEQTDDILVLAAKI